ncbi:hypothetical protein RhiJN_23684 [Ceratobasidium sp. AG-Ba]|nr:hypothetical protein RhiJN_23684 [Ceratobasidium sp. AG-Ba]
MSLTIASLLNTPEGSSILGTKRRTGPTSPETNDSRSKKRRVYASPGCVPVKVDEVTPGPGSPYSERLIYTYPGWCYWLPPPGEPMPLYEPVLVDDNVHSLSPRGAGLGLGLGIIASFETIDIEESKPDGTHPSRHPLTYSYISFISSPEDTEIDPSPRYVPPSPLDHIARSLVESFIAWQQVIAPSEPETKTQPETDRTIANPILQISPVSTREDVSPRYVPPSPVEVITRYLLESFANWRPEGKYPIL